MNVSVPPPHLAPPFSTARQAIDALPCFAAVPERTREALAAQALLHRLPPGALLFEQAEIPVFALFLLSGSLRLVGVRGQTEAVIETARPFEPVLPAAVVTERPYLLRGRVFEEAQLLLIEAATFRAALGEDIALCRAMLDSVAVQLRRQLRAAKSFRLRSAEERVAAYLAGQLAEAKGSVEIALVSDKTEIAAHLGVSRETFSRTLSGLSARGVSVDGKRLRIHDVAAFLARFPPDPFIDDSGPLLTTEQGNRT
ncbi:MAG: helix-turn-helix domain-containing protein [Pseudomonadota bacterium]|nr:helix-turn-helix domain-containing protein [Pseudomonadota bacterium]